jgi:hypothetical protein
MQAVLKDSTNSQNYEEECYYLEVSRLAAGILNRRRSMWKMVEMMIGIEEKKKD